MMTSLVIMMTSLGCLDENPKSTSNLGSEYLAHFSFSLPLKWEKTRPIYCLQRTLTFGGKRTPEEARNSRRSASRIKAIQTETSLVQEIERKHGGRSREPRSSRGRVLRVEVEITHRMHVDGEVNRARCMLQKPTVMAAKTSGTEIFLFDYSKHEENQREDECDPALRLRGHDKEGYGLSWSPFKEGYLLSGSQDLKICLWDVSAAPQDKVLNAMHVYEVRQSVVEDVSWHLKNENIFWSAGDDCQLMIWDLRTNQTQNCFKAHEREVEWDPNRQTVLASSGDDRRLMVWNLNRIGEEQLEIELDAEDGPPEPIFSHGDHKAKISDFSWNKNEPWAISSVAEDNTLQVWQMAESIYREDDDLQAPDE